AGYYLRCRREEDGLHIFVDETYQAKVTGNWGKSVVGLVTEDLPAIYNGIQHYQSGSVAVKTITIDPASCETGESMKLNVTILPLNATNTLLKWESSDPSIVSVDDSGTITRHGQGNVKITAWASDGGVVRGTIDLLETGLNVNESDGAIVLFPNPVNEVLHYAIPDNVKEVSVYSVTGKMLMSQVPDGTNHLSTEDLMAGIYLFVVKTEKEIYTKRFTVIRN
ncbi:MAG: Ig-like domain-containing protein, partial [Paludibacter sp.]|nr:Ig-like domain-containing protein [Paludibacter sp.]